MPLVVLFLAYLLLAGLLVFLSDKLGLYIDLLDKKTKISGAFLGGVLLAAVTSLPELFTSVSAILIVRENSMVVGNILGSNLFNLMVLGICLVFGYKAFAQAKIEYRSHFYTFLGLALIYALIAYGLFVPTRFQPAVGPVNFICIGALVVYALILFLQPKSSSEEEEKETDSPLTVRQIVIRFSICALVLIAASIAITSVTDLIAEEIQLDATVAGALFLAVATSLPELVSCISLCRRGNFNASFGDILGSCLFNFCIIGIGELLSFDRSLIVQQEKESMLMTILTIVGLLAVFALLLVKKRMVDNRAKKKENVGFSVLTVLLGLLTFSGYLIYLAL